LQKTKHTITWPIVSRTLGDIVTISSSLCLRRTCTYAHITCQIGFNVITNAVITNIYGHDLI